MTQYERDALLLGLLEDYEAFMQEETKLTDEQTEAEESFLRRVLGPERYAWLNRGGKYGYGACYDPEENEEE